MNTLQSFHRSDPDIDKALAVRVKRGSVGRRGGVTTAVILTVLELTFREPRIG